MSAGAERYERLIQSTELFSLDKERDRGEYLREARKLVENLYLYLVEKNGERYGDFSLEIVETAKRCIENYEPEAGEFLHYFNAAWAKEYRRASAKQAAEQARVGIHISEDDERALRRVRALLEKRGIANPNEDQILHIAMALDLTPEAVREYILMNESVRVRSFAVLDSDGEEGSLLDTIASEEGGYSRLESKEECRALLGKIEAAYLECQERQKTVISAVMTTKICKVVCEYQIDLSGLTFVNKKIITEYIQTGSCPTARDVAAELGRAEASVSRTLSGFIEKLREK